jgi:hypothetical protein
MFTAYIVVTVFAAAMNAYAAYVDLSGVEWIVNFMTSYGVPQSWLFLLAVLKAAAALGLLRGIAFPLIGSAAALGIVAYFVGAEVTVVRARCWSHIVFPVLFLLPAAASLVLLLTTGGESFDVHGRKRNASGGWVELRPPPW